MEGLPRLFAAALVGVVVSGAGAWVTWGRNVQSREDVIAIVETHNPYVEDRQLIHEAVEEVKALREDIVELKLQLTALHVTLMGYEKRNSKE